MSRSRKNDRALWAQHLEAQLEAITRREKSIEHTHRRTHGELEHEIQVSYIDTIPLLRSEFPALELTYAIPNGGHRHPAVGGKMKREGVRRGMPDLCLPVPVDPWGALYQEVKIPGRNMSAYQVEKAEQLRAAGNVVVVCHSLDELLTSAKNYLSGRMINEQGDIAAGR